MQRIPSQSDYPDQPVDACWHPFVLSLPANAAILVLAAPFGPSTPPLAAAAEPGMVVTVAGLEEPWDSSTNADRYDAVGAEFAFTEATAEQVLRRVQSVLKSGGEGQFVFHHPESVSMARAHAICVEAEYLFESNQAFAILRELFALSPQTSRSDIEQMGNRLHRATSQLKQALASGQSQGHGEFLAAAFATLADLMALRRDGASATASAEAGRAESELRSYADAMRSATQTCPDAAAMDRIAAVARTLGFSRVETQPALLSGAIHGWQLLLHKP